MKPTTIAAFFTGMFAQRYIENRIERKRSLAYNKAKWLRKFD